MRCRCQIEHFEADVTMCCSLPLNSLAFGHVNVWRHLNPAETEVSGRKMCFYYFEALIARSASESEPIGHSLAFAHRFIHQDFCLSRVKMFSRGQAEVCGCAAVNILQLTIFSLFLTNQIAQRTPSSARLPNHF